MSIALMINLKYLLFLSLLVRNYSNGLDLFKNKHLHKKTYNIRSEENLKTFMTKSLENIALTFF